jgi:predicted RNA-binding Zn ribbon-like protein
LASPSVDLLFETSRPTDFEVSDFAVTIGERLPPTQLAVVKEFLNTRDPDGEDRFATTVQMRAWLVRHRLVASQAEFDEDARRHLIEVRDALAALVAANGSASVSRRPVTILNEAARRVRLGVRLHPEDGYRLMSEGIGVDRPIGDLLVRVMGSMAAGTWSRLKMCANPDCGQAFYDVSRNRSGRWCSMAVCGNRMKGRAYRRRRASGVAPLEAQVAPQAVAVAS